MLLSSIFLASLPQLRQREARSAVTFSPRPEEQSATPIPSLPRHCEARSAVAIQTANDLPKRQGNAKGRWKKRFPAIVGRFLSTLLASVFFTFALSATAALAEMPPPPKAYDPRDGFARVDLKQLVPATRLEHGRAIFTPRPVRFSAQLLAAPTPQKAEYLNQVMRMMGMTSPPKVSRRIVVGYGGDKPLAVYIEDTVADRIAKSLPVGETRTFYAFHVYNNRYGPALVVTSFE